MCFFICFFCVFIFMEIFLLGSSYVFSKEFKFIFFNIFCPLWCRYKVQRPKVRFSKSNHEIKDQFALIIHYKKFHKDNIPQEIENAYTVQFLESPIRTNLDYKEQWQIKKTKAKINKQCYKRIVQILKVNKFS